MILQSLNFDKMELSHQYKYARFKYNSRKEREEKSFQEIFSLKNGRFFKKKLLI